MDPNAAVRSLSFPQLANALGLDINLYKTRKGGKEYFGPCPVHQPKNNSTSFSYGAEGVFNCFSCGAKGRGSIDLTKAVKNVGFQAAIELLTPYVGKVSANEKSPTVGQIEEAGELKPFTGKYHLHQVELPWLTARVPDKAIREKFGVFAYDNPARKSEYKGKVLIPVKDMEGVLYGYLARNPEPKEGEWKYKFPSGLPKSRFLFGSDVLKSQHQLPVKVCYVLESPFAVMKFASLGLAAVSPYGWSVSDKQLQLLRTITRGIVYLPDRNKQEAGSSTLVAIANVLWVRFPPLPAGVDDPEQLSLEQIQALTR